MSESATNTTKEQPGPYPETTAQPIVRSGGWNLRLVWIMFLLIMSGELGFLAFAYPANALPQIGAAFQTDQLAWLQTVFALTGAVTAALVGNLADRLGKKKILLAIIAVVAIGLLISAFAPNFAILLFGRALQGVSISFIFMLPSLIRDVFPTRAVPLAVSLSAAGQGIFSIGTTLLVGVVIVHLGYQGAFWTPAVFAALLFLLTWAFVPESTVRSRRPVDVVGALLIGLGVAAVLLGISLGPTWGWTSPNTWIIVGIGVLLLVGWAVQALRSKAPLVDLRTLGHFPLAVTLALSAIAGALVTWMYVVTPIIALSPGGDLGWGLGLTPEGQGVIAAIFSAGGFVSGFLVGWALTKIPAPWVAVMVFAILGLGFVLALLLDQNVAGYAVASFVVGMAGSAAVGLVYNLVILVVPADRQAATASVVSITYSIAAATLPVILFAIMNSTAITVEGAPAPVFTQTSLTFALLVPAGLAALAVILSALLAMRSRGGRELQAGTRS